MNQTLTRGQEAVLRAFNGYGIGLDDQGLAVYVHHISDLNMSSSGVRTRRVELERKGFVGVVGVKRTKSGRSAAVHGITARGKRLLADIDRARVAVAA